MPVSQPDHYSVANVIINGGDEVLGFEQDKPVFRLDAGNLSEEGLDETKRLIEIFPHD